MKDKIKGALSLFFMTFTFFLMMETKYSRALGDYIIEFLGLRAWTEGSSRFHLSIIYFGVLFIIGCFLVRDNVVVKLNKKKRLVFVYSVILISIYCFCTSGIFILIKSNSEGLLAIGFESSSDSYFEISTNDQNKIDEFKITIELKNYSSKEKTFSIQLENIISENSKTDLLSIYTNDGDLALFKLQPKETKIFILTSESYELKLETDNNNSYQNTSISYHMASVNYIVLTDKTGKKIYLDKSNFLGMTV